MVSKEKISCYDEIAGTLLCKHSGIAGRRNDITGGEKLSEIKEVDYAIYKFKSERADDITKTVCEIYETDLEIKKDRIYIKYEEASKWGWNGKNF